MKEIDATDRRILTALQQNARMTNSELAQQVELSGAGLQKRLRKLEGAQIIKRYVALVDHEAVGYDMLCFIQVTLQRHEPMAVERFRQVVQAMPEVLECHHTTGEHDYLLKVALRNRQHLEHFLLHRLTPVPGMDKIRTSLVLSEIKVTTALPME